MRNIPAFVGEPERNRVYHCDALTLLGAMADGSVDSVVTDPPYGLAFMGKRWDYDVPGVDIWRECLRVLKPGGHLLAFAGTRTQHRMAVRIEDAGFEIRDMIAWVYSTGFPKSMDVSKAIDREAGAVRDVVGVAQGAASSNAESLGTFRPVYNMTAPATDEARAWQGWGTALKPSFEPVTVARKPLAGTVAANVLAHGTGGINVDGCRVGGPFDGETQSHSLGRWPANFIHDGSDEVGRLLNGAARFFYTPKASAGERNEGLGELALSRKAGAEFRPNHMQKAEEGETGNPYGRWNETRNHHPTVKPVDLMRYLCRLVTPPGGVVLDPFMGSGTTALGARAEGFDYIGCEIEWEYVEIARGRLAVPYTPPLI